MRYKVDWIKKYVSLQHQCLKKTVSLAMLYIALFETILFAATFFIAPNDADNINLITVIFYMVIITAMYIISFCINNYLKLYAFFRSSRKRYYISSIVYILILSLVFSTIHMVLSFIYGLIFKNIDVNQLNNINFIFMYSNTEEIVGQFIFYTLMIFVSGLVINIITILIFQYNQKYYFVFVLIGVGGYVFGIYKNIIAYLENGNLIVINCIFLASTFLLIYNNWILVKKIDIKD
jgi:hypothetical protein